MGKTYTLDDLAEIVETLRSDKGCPWDRQQTHESLRACMIEEAYEAVEGIRILEETGSWENLCEELGDVLLQVVMHSQIAREEDLFTLSDVIGGISEKMIRRHPHVFKDQDSSCTADEVPASWEEIKRREKKKRADRGQADVPRCLPALLRAVKVQKKREGQADKNASMTENFDSVRKLLDSLETGAQSGAEEETVGELLMEICRICAKRKINAEQALADILDKLG